MDLAKNTLAELQELATELGIEFAKNTRKNDLIELINLKNNDNSVDEISEDNSEIQEDKVDSFEDKSLSEIMERFDFLIEKVKSKKVRNDEIIKNNAYLDGRISEIKQEVITDEHIAQIENLNKIKNENSRQYSENTKQITEFEGELLKLDSVRTKLAFDEYESKKSEYKKAFDDLSLYPEVIAKTVKDIVDTHKLLSDNVVNLREELILLCNKFGLKFDEVDVEQGKLTVSEKAQLVRRLNDLSKISDRLNDR